MHQVVIIGGGLAGLTLAKCLASENISCLLIEKKHYPFHRVCGEYVSNEVAPFLKANDLFPEQFNPPLISRLQLTSVNGKSASLDLDMGGFGISRYSFDNFIYEKAREAGVSFLLDTEVENVSFINNSFQVKTTEKVIEAEIVIGAFGKRSKLDITLKRKFITQRSPYVGVKYHVRTNHPEDLIALHNFEEGYCGISNVEEGKSCLCYLSHRSNFKKYGDVKSVEQHVLFRNPFLRRIFSEAEFLFARPEVINEISFESKSPVEDHMLMCGDSAGMITPLCGNGMAIALHTAKLASSLLVKYFNRELSRSELERLYTLEWKQEFATRLWVGRQIQKLFGSQTASNLAVNLATHLTPVANFLVKKTHGEVF